MSLPRVAQLQASRPGDWIAEVRFDADRSGITAHIRWARAGAEISRGLTGEEALALLRLVRGRARLLPSRSERDQA